ncbi:MAG: polyribonucleotide nucleotidyltransferase [Fibrobacterales bacterium]
MLQKIEETVEYAPGKSITFETGRLAKQAGGAALVKAGEAQLLCTTCCGGLSKGDFFPLTVEYKEKAYAAGKLPGGFFKREARPSEAEILTCRTIDRPIRPMFPEGFMFEVQIIATVLSADPKLQSDILGVSAASLATGLSDIPFEEQVAGVRVALINGEHVINPSHTEMEDADLELVVAGTETSVCMVEGGAWEQPEEVIIAAITAGHEAIKKLCVAQTALVAKAGKEKFEFVTPVLDADIVTMVEEKTKQKLIDAFHQDMTKTNHYPEMKKIQDELLESLGEDFDEAKIPQVKTAFGDLKKNEMRRMILEEGRRIDGRKTDDIRAIDTESSVLPSTHGSAVFQRGETQGLVTCTLGTKSDEQMVETLHGIIYKNYMLHYNFPPYSVGETKRVGSVSRREIGHGHLAERSLYPILPHPEDFPYTIRIVSEIMESNGSSSMASVCGGSMALMDAGVPTKCHVAGIAMGLISEGDDVKILSDITGTEDHLGDMDFKVTGTKDGITAFQMDIKIKGITPELMAKSMTQAKAGRLHIISEMEKNLPEPRKELSEKAPVIMSFIIDQKKIRDVIGPGGQVIRGIQEATGATISINDDGQVSISAVGKEKGQKAREMVEEIIAEAEPGKIYDGKVKRVTSFGAFVEIIPGKEGLLHISELAAERVDKVEDVLNVGDEVRVKCLEIDPRGRINLSKKAVEE